MKMLVLEAEEKEEERSKEVEVRGYSVGEATRACGILQMMAN